MHRGPTEHRRDRSVVKDSSVTEQRQGAKPIEGGDTCPEKSAPVRHILILPHIGGHVKGD